MPGRSEAERDGMRKFDRLARTEVLATGTMAVVLPRGGRGRADAQVPVESENAPPTTTAQPSQIYSTRGLR